MTDSTDPADDPRDQSSADGPADGQRDERPVAGSAGGTRDESPVETPPSISCERCGREWDLTDELEHVGNQAFEQFALDHRRHTGHFPDGVATWRAACRNCPETAERLSEDAVRRWAEIHARHTRHAVDVRHGDGEDPTRVRPPD